MKTVIYFLAIVAVSAATNIETYSISDNLKEALEGLRDEMPCGFPEWGIGPLAPLSIAFKEIDFETSKLKIAGIIKNFTANNLNLFEILELKHKPFKRTISFRFLFENVNVNTWYDLKTVFQDFGLTVKLNGTGINYYAVNNVHISGSLKYGISIATSKVSIKNLKLIPHIESAESKIEGILGSGSLNEKFNKHMEEDLPAFINKYGESIADDLIAVYLPKINDLLSQYKPSGKNVEEKIKCQPQNQ